MVNNTQNRQDRVTKILKEIGIPTDVKGYRYNRDAILMLVDDENLASAITLEVYPGIAKKYKATSSSVERAIRHSITGAWKRYSVDTPRIVTEMFSNTINSKRGRPTNGEFLSCIADYVRSEEARA